VGMGRNVGREREQKVGVWSEDYYNVSMSMSG